MKRAIALLLALLLAGCAFAEEAGFSFRGGVRWGMSADEVLEIEGEPPFEAERESGLDVIVIEGAMHENSECALRYYFFDDSLTMAEIEYDTEAGPATFEALADSLSGRYGEAAELNPSLTPGLPAENDEDTPNRFYGWVHNDETLVCLTEDRSEHTLTITLSDLGE